MTDQEIEKIIKSNMMLTMNFVGIRQDLEQKLKRKPLTDAELFKEWEKNTSCDMPDTFTQFKHTAQAIEAAHGIKGEA